MHELALFAGIGGGILGGLLCGFKTVCAIEIDGFCREVLLRRQMDGCLPKFPIWDDIKTFDGKSWRGKIDVVTGGFPCQDISAAGTHKGLAGSRSGLVFEMLRIIEEVQPAFVLAENSPYLRTNGLGRIVKELSCMGYVGRVGILGAWHIGAPHKRNRMWIVAYSDSFELREQHWRSSRSNWKDPTQSSIDGKIGTLANNMQCGCRQRKKGRFTTGSSGKQEQTIQTTDANSTRSATVRTIRQKSKNTEFENTSWWDVEPRLDRVANGIPHQVDRIRTIGNGQVPEVARLAWNILSKGLRYEG